MTQKYGTNHPFNYVDIFPQAFPKDIVTAVRVSILHMEEGRKEGIRWVVQGVLEGQLQIRSNTIRPSHQ